MRTLSLLLSLSVFTACGVVRPPCDSIKVGDKVTPKADNCFASSNYGALLAGTCGSTGKWACADATFAGNTYAQSCKGAYSCMVQVDEQEKVTCVKHFCQD
jgi:hypothetical protein